MFSANEALHLTGTGINQVHVSLLILGANNFIEGMRFIFSEVY